MFALAAAGLCNTANAATACVWRVVNAPAPFYLVGTIHALSGHDYPLPKPYYQALNDSKRLLFEVDPHPKNNSRCRLSEPRNIRKATSIQRHVHPQTWEYLAKNLPLSWSGKQNYSWNCFLTVSIKCGRGRSPACGEYTAMTTFSSEHGVDNYLELSSQRMGNKPAVSKRIKAQSKCFAECRTLMRS